MENGWNTIHRIPATAIILKQILRRIAFRVVGRSLAASINSGQGGTAPRCTARFGLIGGRRYRYLGGHRAAVTFVDGNGAAVVERDTALIVRQHHDLGADPDAGKKIDDVGVLQPDAAARDMFADRR